MYLNLKSDAFRPENSHEYLLYLQLENEALTYCVYDPLNDLCLIFTRHPYHPRSHATENAGRIEEIIRDDKMLSLKYKAVKVLFYSQNSTLVPAELFNENVAGDYLRYNHYPDTNPVIFTDHINLINAYNIFSIPEYTVSVFNIIYEKAIFVHHSTPFICNASSSCTNNGEVTVHAGINSGFMDIAVFKGNELMLYNNFQYSGEADLLYYTLFIYKQMSLDTENIRLFISGEMSRKLSYTEILKQNIKNIVCSTPVNNVRFATELSSINPNKYLNLISLITCASPEENIKAEK